MSSVEVESKVRIGIAKAENGEGDEEDKGEENGECLCSQLDRLLWRKRGRGERRGERREEEKEEEREGRGRGKERSEKKEKSERG